ncbi:hypothetical protein BJ508DRAFT_32176 [Ascobolus immersus RN42]|uniref:Uncharacterized protein n=1 Tax=Ascobolus immersus RN42 TaxID=1160509 RepID=A0A3N4IG34_ASCIM|nr:hypothetical protein BJ508DRAFT_32176 [Ascobolus immersus RN42]
MQLRVYLPLTVFTSLSSSGPVSPPLPSASSTQSTFSDATTLSPSSEDDFFEHNLDALLNGPQSSTSAPNSSHDFDIEYRLRELEEDYDFGVEEASRQTKNGAESS